MRRQVSILLIAMFGLQGGCSREQNLRCDRDDIYREAVSAGTLRVPDDLSVPDEGESLIIPSGNPGRAEPEPGACLDDSPALSNQPRSDTP